MKQLKKQHLLQSLFTVIIIFFSQLSVWAQDATTVEVNGHNVGNWFGRNWMWVAGVIVVLVLLLLFSGGSSRRKTTTIVHKDDGTVRKVITTEEED